MAFVKINGVQITEITSQNADSFLVELESLTHPPQDLDLLTFHRGLEHPDHLKTLLIQSRAGGIGLFQLQGLPWDSQILGWPSARLNWLMAKNSADRSEIYQTLLREVHQSLSTFDLAYVTARVESSDWLRVHELGLANFQPVDGLLTFGQTLKEEPMLVPPPQPFQLRAGKSEDERGVGELAASVFSRSRFHNDPVVGLERANHLHCEWGKNTVRGVAAQKVFVVEVKDQLVGFVSCKVHHSIGVIDLIGVAPRATGQGLGKLLLNQAAHWFWRQKLQHIEVSTQMNSREAIRLYQGSGYTFQISHLTFRWHQRQMLAHE